MALIAWLEHGDAVALSRKGEVTVALPVGVDTVTAAMAGVEHNTASAETSRQRDFIQRLTVSGCVAGLQDLSLLGVRQGLCANANGSRLASLKIYSSPQPQGLFEYLSRHYGKGSNKSM